MIHQNIIKEVVAQLSLLGDYNDAAPYGSGHINQTLALIMNQGGSEVRYILQRINKSIFKDPVGLMDNISRVLYHSQAKLKEQGAEDASRRAMTLIPAIDGKPYVLDSEGEYWRCYIFVENATGHDIIETEDQAFQAAKSFGSFQGLVSDLPGEPLIDTIPNFHNTVSRFDAFESALAADTQGRSKDVAPEIAFIMEHKSLCTSLLNLLESGAMPLRVTHNDTKLNNVLLDNVSQEDVCVIDLDTTMSGSALYDFGDLVRTSTSPVAEDEPNSELVRCQANMFEALVKGYLTTAKSFLNSVEVDNLVTSGMLITYEVGVRFLTDYLVGDVYFKTKHPNHNLERCRTQIALVKSIEDQKDSLEAIVKKVHAKS
jgi:hypothetical protein